MMPPASNISLKFVMDKGINVLGVSEKRSGIQLKENGPIPASGAETIFTQRWERPLNALRLPFNFGFMPYIFSQQPVMEYRLKS